MLKPDKFMPIKISILLTFMLLAKQPTFSSSFCETYETNTPEKIIDYINNVIFRGNFLVLSKIIMLMSLRSIGNKNNIDHAYISSAARR